MAKEPNSDVDRPFRLVTAPARFGLIIGIVAAIAGLLWLFGGSLAVKTVGSGVIVNPPGNVPVYSTATGTVGPSLYAAGDTVESGDFVAMVRTFDGLDVPILAPIGGTVVSLSTVEYALIDIGAPVLTIAPKTEPMVGLIFVPSVSMADVEPGQRVEVTPETTDPTTDGYLIGVVSSIDPLPVTAERLQLILGDGGLAEELLAQGPIQEVFVEFEPDASAPLSLKWSGPGPQDAEDVQSGTIVGAKIVLRNQTPWQAFTGG